MNRLKVSTIIGTVLTFMLGIGCAMDWAEKISIGEDWSMNVGFHFLASLIFVIFFLILLIQLVSPRYPELIQTVRTNLKINIFRNFLLALGFILVFGWLLVVSSELILNQSLLGQDTSIAFLGLHIVSSLMLGSSLLAFGYLISSQQLEYFFKNKKELFMNVSSISVIGIALAFLFVLILFY